MDTSAIIESFIEFKDDKNIDRITLMGLLEQAFRSLLIKQYGSDDNFDIVVNANKGDLQIFHNKVIVKDDMVEDQNSEIGLSDALKIEDDFEIGREKMLQVCYDLYPDNSSYYQSISNAWASTGIGNQFYQGDVNSDLVLNIQDIILIIQSIVNNYDLDPFQFFTADINSDQAIDIFDIILLVNGIIES